MRMTWLFGHGNAPHAPVIVALLVLLNALLLRAIDPDALVRLRDLAFDSYQRIKPRVVPDDLPVRIVDIDEAALERRCRGFRRRHRHARSARHVRPRHVAGRAGRHLLLRPPATIMTLPRSSGSRWCRACFP